jgi:asparagine synthase (glutamine-hydrolysing)
MYYLAREARRQVTVALSGDGGDESFGGYPRHAALAMSEGMGPRGRRLLARLGRRMAPRAGRKSRWNAARRFLTTLDLDPLPRYLAWRSLFSAEDLAALATPEFAAAALADDPLTAWRGAIAGLESRPWVDRAMAIDLADYLPNDCLAKVDVASMRHSLEVRSPMLDHRVVELARRMPADLKWRRRLGRLPQGKAVLREAFARDLPASILRRGKMGFGVPVSRWLATEHADWMRGILLDRRTLARGLTRRGFVEEMIAAHTALRADYGEPLWALVCLELWFRAFGV